MGLNWGGPMWGKGKATVDTGASDLPELDETYSGWTASLIVDRQDRTLFAREGYYFEMRGIYTLARVDAGNVWEDDVDTGDLRYGGALGIGADTAIGPLYLAYGVADEGFNRWYFSLGTAF